MRLEEIAAAAGDLIEKQISGSQLTQNPMITRGIFVSDRLLVIVNSEMFK